MDQVNEKFGELRIGFDKKAWSRSYFKKRAVCPTCGADVLRHGLKRHQKTMKCQFIAFAKAYTGLKLN